MEKTPGKRIAILGAESSGKSTLSQLLAFAVHANVINEYARYYCNHLERIPSLDDVIHIADIQWQEYVDTLDQNDVFVFDTTIHTSVIWMEDKFGYLDPAYISKASAMNFDLILLCDSDIPWQYDVLREDPLRRKELEEKTIELLRQLGQDFVFISGDINDRLRQSLVLFGMLI